MEMETLHPHFKIVADFETSGNCPIRNGIISACILVINGKDEVVDEFVRYVRPPDHTRKNWSIEAQGVHGITFEQVENFMPNDQFCYEFLCFISKYKTKDFIPFICHASAQGWFSKTEGWIIVRWFDFTFFEWAFRKALFADGQEMIWTLNKVLSSNFLISTVNMGRKAGYKTNKLNQWAERISFELKHHDAKSDTYCALEIYKYLKERENHGIRIEGLPTARQGFDI